jgi:prepilin-type N-terminal cleavage/methylation domain-containing protein
MKRPGSHNGMTVLELMVVLAIIAGASILVRSGFRLVTKADLVDNSTELSAVMRRASTLAVEHGEMHRVVIDLDTQLYTVEVCQGATAIARNEALRATPEEKARALEKGKNAFANMPAQASESADPQDAEKRALAVAGQHVSDRTCVTAGDVITGAAEGKDDKGSVKGWVRHLKADKGIKFKEIWVQHRDESVTKGQVAIYFFPNGASEKAVVELTDGSEVFSVLVFGLTGRVELHDGVLKDVNDHMLRNVMGDKNAAREDTK